MPPVFVAATAPSFFPEHEWLLIDNARNKLSVPPFYIEGSDERKDRR
jgi:hypothetical protein